MFGDFGMIGGVPSQSTLEFQVHVNSLGFGPNSWENGVGTILKDLNNQAYYDEKRAQIEVT